VLVTGAAGFVGGDCSMALRGQRLLASRGISLLLAAAPFTHVLHLVAQAGVRYAMRAPQTYVASNVAGLVLLHEPPWVFTAAPGPGVRVFGSTKTPPLALMPREARRGGASLRPHVPHFQMPK
jgi:hypothetical protein